MRGPMESVSGENLDLNKLAEGLKFLSLGE
jgi:hypothetical protein